MFLRKLTVLLVPLGLMLLLCLLIPLFGSMDAFFGPLLLGAVLGVMLALLLPLHAAKRKNLTGICRVIDGHATELHFCSPSIVRVRVFPGTDTNIQKKSIGKHIGLFTR